MDSRRLAGGAARHRVGRDRGDRARPAGAVAAGRRGAQRAALRVPGRRAHRGAPHAGRAEPPLRRCRTTSTRWARSTPTRSPACARRRGRARATRTRCTRRLMTLGAITERRGARQRALGGGAGRAREGRPRDAAGVGAASAVGRGRAARADAPALSAGATLQPPIASPRRLRGRPRESPEEALRELLRARLGGLGPGDRRRARRAAGPAARRDRVRAGGAAGRGHRVPGPRHAGPGRRRVVRAPPAGAHPSLHAGAAAARDRAGGAARLRALPVRVAARGRRLARERARGAAGGAGAARRLRGAGRRCGRPRCCRRA